MHGEKSEKGQYDSFPFLGVVGQDRAKLSLILGLVDTSIGAILLRGLPGSGKTTLARSLTHIAPEIEVLENCRFQCDPADPRERWCTQCKRKATTGKGSVVTRPMTIVNLPNSISEDRLVGSIDIAQAVEKGRIVFNPGILASAHRQILYVDEVNLLPDHIVDMLLDVTTSGINVVEREGFSITHPSRFLLVGSMNPEEGELRPQLFDRFALQIKMDTDLDAEDRARIVQNTLKYENQTDNYLEALRSQHKAIKTKITEARRRLPHTKIPQDLVDDAAKYCYERGLQTARADLTICKLARARAAFLGRTIADHEDLEIAQSLIEEKYWHTEEDTPRRKIKLDDILGGTPHPPPEESSEKETDAEDRKTDRSGSLESRIARHAPERRPAHGGPTIGLTFVKTYVLGKARKLLGRETGEKVQKELQPSSLQKRSLDSQTLSRTLQRSVGAIDVLEEMPLSGRRPDDTTQRGRCIQYTTTPSDIEVASSKIHWPATLTAAAKRTAKKKPHRFCIKPLDVRRKLTSEDRPGTTLFLLDCSESMKKNSNLVIRILETLLENPVFKRSRNAAVCFQNTGGRIIQQPTSNRHLLLSKARKITFEGASPLGAGLRSSHRILRSERLRHGGQTHLVLLSDGYANIAGSGDPKGTVRSNVMTLAAGGTDAINAALQLSGVPGIRSTVFDFSPRNSWILGNMTSGSPQLLREIARVIGGIYVRLKPG